MSIFASLFGGVSNSSQPAPQANQPAPQSAQPSPGNLPAEAPGMQSSQNNPNAPASQNPQAPQNPAADGDTQVTGLDQFKELWSPVESPAGGQQQQLFNLDPKELMTAAQKIDFAKVIKPEQLQAISQGGEAAVQSFASALNTVAQTVYAQSAHTTAKLVEQAIAKSQESFRNELPQHIKRQTVSETLRAENPALSHPAASPILGALEQQLTMKFPNASAHEISGLAKNYLESFASSFQKPQTAPQGNGNQAGQDETDWSKYL